MTDHEQYYVDKQNQLERLEKKILALPVWRVFRERTLFREAARVLEAQISYKFPAEPSDEFKAWIMQVTSRCQNHPALEMARRSVKVITFAIIVTIAGSLWSGIFFVINGTWLDILLTAVNVSLTWLNYRNLKNVRTRILFMEDQCRADRRCSSYDPKANLIPEEA